MKKSIKQPIKSTVSLKIALVCDDSLDKHDGVQQYVLTLGAWLASQGHDVHYITSSTSRTDLPNLHVLSKNMRVRFNGNRLGIPLPASIRKIRRLLAAESFDLIHVQMPYSPLLAGLVIRLAPPKTVIVGTFHIYPESKFVASAAHLLAALQLPQRKRFQEVVAVSEAAQQFAYEAFRIKTSVIPNMVDIVRFKSAPVTKRDSDIIVTFLGRLVERKGAQYLLQAIVYLKAHALTDRKFKVKIGGKGPLAAQLKEYVVQHGLKDIVSFDGFIAEEDKVAYLADSDIAVFPSTDGESFGISVVEALAASRGVVIAGDNPGYRTVMRGRESQLVDPKDTDMFAHLLAKYISRSDERSAAYSWQQQRAEVFHTDVVGSDIIELYKRALRMSQK